ncbi:major capsid protein [Micromonospora sp. M12]
MLNGIAAAAETALQMSQKIKASQAFFADQTINADSAVDANGFDGLNKMLTGTTTEYLPLANGVTTGYIDLTTIDTKQKALQFMLHVNSWLGKLDGKPDALFMNSLTKAYFLFVASWSGQLDQTTNSLGDPIEKYRGIELVDLGAKAGSNNDVIGTASKDTDAGGAGGTITGLSDIYAVRFGLDGFHGVSMAGRPLVQNWMPDFSTAGAVKTGEVEMGPVAVVLKRSKAAGVLRNLKVAA